MLKITEFEPEETEGGLTVREKRTYKINAQMGNLHGLVHDIHKISEELDIPLILLSFSLEDNILHIDYRPTGIPLFKVELDVSDS